MSQAIAHSSRRLLSGMLPNRPRTHWHPLRLNFGPLCLVPRLTPSILSELPLEDTLVTRRREVCFPIPPAFQGAFIGQILGLETPELCRGFHHPWHFRLGVSPKKALHQARHSGFNSRVCHVPPFPRLLFLNLNREFLTCIIPL